jgi:hypothetical protein
LAGDGPRSVTTADFDGDGYDDIAVAIPDAVNNSGNVSVLFNATNVPVAVDDSAATDEDSTLTVAAQAGVLGNDTDVNNTP